MSIETEWENLVAWFEALFHHAHAGTLPPAPVVGGPPVSVPPINPVVITPPAPPLPLPPVVPVVPVSTLPAGAVLTHGICGMTDAVKAKIDAIRARNPQTNVFSAFYAPFFRQLLTIDDQRVEADWQMSQTYPMIPGAEFDPVAIAKEVSGLQPVTSVHPFVIGSGVVPGCVVFHGDYKTESDVLAKIDLIDAAGGYAGGSAGGIVVHS